MNYADARIVGRLLRVIFGLFLAVGFAAVNPEILFSEALLISLVGVIIFYILYTILVGNRLLAKVNPWMGALIMDWPLLVVWVVVLGHLPGLPSPLILAVFLYFGLSLVISGVVKYGGCEVVTIPGLVLRRRYNVACIMFSPIDWLEARIGQRISNGPRPNPS
jgi:amino acid transporter